MKFDHQRVVSLRAVESYLLDELSPALREGFEEHFFECPECAEALRAGLILQQNGRALLRAEPHLAVAAGITGNQAEERPGTEVWWRAWPRIPSLLPMAAAVFLAFFVLFGVLLWDRGFGTGGNGARDGDPVVSVRPFRIAAASREASASIVIESGNLQPIVLDVKTDGPYLWIVRQTQKGGTAFQGTADAHRGELSLILQTRRLAPGGYEISLRKTGDPSAEEKLYQFTLKRTP